MQVTDRIENMIPQVPDRVGAHNRQHDHGSIAEDIGRQIRGYDHQANKNERSEIPEPFGYLYEIIVKQMNKIIDREVPLRRI
jgi:hypothetical protein